MWIDASPDTVFEVISSADHLVEWWPDHAEIDATPGGTGRFVFGTPGSPDAHVPEVTVIQAVPPRLFSFRWTHARGSTATDGNSLLVTFELSPDGDGTVLRMSETGFAERYTEPAAVEDLLREHESGWDHFLPRLVAYAPTVEPRP